MTTAVSHVRMAVYSLGAGKAVCAPFADWLLRLKSAHYHLREALALLNREGHPPQAKRQVMRMLNWIRWEMRAVAHG